MAPPDEADTGPMPPAGDQAPLAGVSRTDCACGQPRRAGLAPPVQLASDGVTARLEGVAVLVCDRGHREVVDRDLARRLLAAVDAQLLVARPRRLRRDDACGDCGAVLTMPGRTTETPVVADGGPTVVTLVPTMEMVRCPDCGREQLPTATGSTLHALVEALVAAMGGD